MDRRQSPDAGAAVPARGRERTAARSFYGDVLGGRQVWSTGRPDGSLWFLVGETLVEVSAGSDGGGEPAPIVLEVDAPEELAERCWDAGFTVRVHDYMTDREAVSVVDPSGRRIDLVRGSLNCSCGTIGEEER
jgi:catechol 2,3-dioxygenase-like lactoylglutathione lyase family enzyme